VTKISKEKKRKIIIHPATINTHFVICCTLYTYIHTFCS